MYRGPKDTLDRITVITKAWERLRPAKSFGGMTLDQFKEGVKAMHDVRAELSDLEARVHDAKTRRVALDEAANRLAKIVVSGVKADREEGDDGELYAAMGFVRTSDRSSGLTRRRGNGEMKSEENAA
jgi:hypothetical protein